MFNALQDSFPTMFTKHEDHKPKWTMKGIQIPRKNKRHLYITCRNMNDPKEKDYYEKYCAVLRRIIKEAKRIHCNNLIKVSANQIKAMWNTIRENTGKTKKPNENLEIKLETGIILNGKILASVFNDYFSKTIKNLNINNTD